MINSHACAVQRERFFIKCSLYAISLSVYGVNNILTVAIIVASSYLSCHRYTHKHNISEKTSFSNKSYVSLKYTEAHWSVTQTYCNDHMKWLQVWQKYKYK